MYADGYIVMYYITLKSRCWGENMSPNWLPTCCNLSLPHYSNFDYGAFSILKNEYSKYCRMRSTTRLFLLCMTVKMMMIITTLESHTEKQMNQRSTVQRELEWDMFNVFSTLPLWSFQGAKFHSCVNHLLLWKHTVEDWKHRLNLDDSWCYRWGHMTKI